MFGLFKKKPAVPDGPDRSTLVPRIKTHHFTAALKQMPVPADQLPYTEPLVADLLVTYAFDMPHTFMMASLAALAELGIPLPEVRALAMANLKRQLPQIGFTDHGPFQRIVTGENLEACVLLAGNFWNQVAAELGDEVVVSVPNRDLVLYCGSRSTEGLAALRTVADEVLAEENTHNLSGYLLVWRDGRWQVFAEPGAAAHGG